jgi:hypothetical protein
MTTEEKRKLIHQCVDDGNWGAIGDEITRNDLMDYLLHFTNPTITEKGLKIKKLPKIDCPLCGKSVKPYSVTLTHRAVKYLLCAVYLSEKDKKNGGDGYVHYEVIRDFCQGKYKYLKGKRLGKGISFTSYSTLTTAPWDFLSPKIKTKDKVQRDGTLIPTEKCMDFLRGKIGVPQRCEFLDTNVVRTGGGIVYAATAKDMDWKSTVDNYKTF